jgi:xanthine dehydrogenase accessory factor
VNEWIDELSDLAAANEAVVMVTIVALRGSAPREVGAKMLVTQRETIGTIGGGQLEHQCTRIAVRMLAGEECSSVRNFPLGSAMGQCCGGVVDVLFEPLASGLPEWLRDLRALHGQRERAALLSHIGSDRKYVLAANRRTGASAGSLPAAIQKQTMVMLDAGDCAMRLDDWFVATIVASDFNIAVFGAGHVGTAVVAALSSLDCNIRWIDSRRNFFRGASANVRTIEAAEPALEVAAMPPGSLYLVMTHNHALDFDICDRILRRRDSAYCGLIGSRSKRRRFEKRYRQQGMPDLLLDFLTCPIGVDGIAGKKPAEIAVAAAAEVLQAYEQATGENSAAYPDNVHPLRK